MSGFTLDGGGMERDVHISACGRYRYWLTRRWGPGPELLWVMLNPSTADHRDDDPTIRRCIGFSRREGYGALRVVNLYAFRATAPSELVGAPDPIGPLGNRELLAALEEADVAVAAWGAFRGDGWRMAYTPGERARDVIESARILQVELRCLGLTRSGHPRHPLFVAKEQTLEPYPHAPQETTR